jgi:hypothetical protein
MRSFGVSFVYEIRCYKSTAGGISSLIGSGRSLRKPSSFEPLAASSESSLALGARPRFGILSSDVADEGKDRAAIQFSFIVGAALTRCAGA